MKKIIAVLSLVFPLAALALSADTTTSAFDSGVVADSTAWTSGAVKLSRVESLEIFVDNALGTGVRTLTMTSYADPSCATTIDSVVLRKVSYGTAIPGATYSPGRARGFIGPDATGDATFEATLLDTTAPVAGAVDVNLWTEDFEYLTVSYRSGGAGAQGTYSSLYDDGNTEYANGPNAAATSGVAYFGPGATLGNMAGGGNAAFPFKVPRRLRLQYTGVAAVQTRLVVTGHGRVPGTFSHRMVLPVCAKFSLSAATGTVQAWGVAR